MSRTIATPQLDEVVPRISTDKGACPGMQRRALVVGATGIAGYNTSQALLRDDWPVIGLSRRPSNATKGVEHVYADVLDPVSVEAALHGKDISHLFFTTWSRQATEADNCRVNGAMLANTLSTLAKTTQLQHVVLVTGLKHYLGPSRLTLRPRRRRHS